MWRPARAELRAMLRVGLAGRAVFPTGSQPFAPGTMHLASGVGFDSVTVNAARDVHFTWPGERTYADQKGRRESPGRART